MTRSMEDVSPGLLKVMEIARKKPGERVHSLCRLLTPELLTWSYYRLRKDAAVGVDGVTVEDYGKNLEENIRSLFERMKGGQYRHQPIRRVYIPKEGGKLRPLGISATEDKVVQRALTTVLEAIYEVDFKDFSYGFRPGRSAHDALRAMNGMVEGGRVHWILEADIKAYFDNIDRSLLREMLSERIADEPFLRLVGKCLHVGVLEGDSYSEPGAGTAQGSILSPMMGNIYLHHVLDGWFETQVRPRLAGKAYVVRYADDYAIGFEREEDAERVMKVIHQRFARYGLELHPEKTRLIQFTPPRGEPDGQSRESFDFLGFTHYWRRTRAGRWRLAVKTRKGRFRKAIQAITEFCRRQRHKSVKEQHASLIRRLRGHYNYFGVSGNFEALARLEREATRIWFKWLNRRSQRSSYTWDRFNRMLEALPLPRPRVRVSLWGQVHETS